ncbi:GFA family protein [Pseudomonas lalucatii]|uniref:GFA family protein n=1 Tax=Pseudomonas lalucatii TaxID=1424203 RepID=A0ABS5Q8E7_9PSED|nr:GFA family protein [Pseudomonas lalucatii]MBS7664428.1 GFA family protein [Pseudomonas lalucatii]MBS7691046.1 GFA family protein [Pseudomonas lalucatii]MBS7725615.1 GFA family protein [Pseudomonas lalucatii]QVM88766.1 GFA family protein [Pseudomonas lalucatii]
MSEIHCGGCQCGALRYRFEAPLRDVAHCHCSMCRRCSGGIVTTWVTVPLASFQWLAGTPREYASSAGCTRRFCGNCGAQLCLFTTLSPGTLDVTVATLDHPERAPADRHIWVQNRLPWLHLDEHLPQERQESLP